MMCKKNANTEINISFIAGIIIFLLWGIVYLCYFPGVFSYDISIQTQMITGKEIFSTQQPVIHTLFWKLMIALSGGSGEKAIVLYSVTQMLIFCALITLSMNRLLARTKGRTAKIFLVIATCFYGLNPIVSLFSFSTCKNVLFSGLFLTFVVQVLDIVLPVDKEDFSNEKLKYFFLFTNGLLCCLFLNNFSYVLFAFSIVWFFVLVKKKESQAPATCIFLGGVGFLVLSMAFTFLGVEKGPSKEMLSVPLQQMVYAKEKGALDEDEIIELKSFFENNDYGYFQFGNVDKIKSAFMEDYYKEHKGEFWKLYGKCLIRKPGEAAIAFIRLNLPLWAPIPIDIKEYSMVSYIEDYDYGVEIEGFNGFSRHSVFRGLLKVYENIASFDAFRGSKVLTLIFGVSFPLLVMAVSTIVLMIKKKWNLILVLLPAWLLFFTHLLGPLSNMRYALPMVILMPLEAFLIFICGKNENS